MFLDGFFILLQNWRFLSPDDLKLSYDDVTVPVVADVFCRCHDFPAVAGVLLLLASIKLLAFLLWLPFLLLLINAMLFAGFPDIAEVPHVAEFAAVAGVPTIAR